MANMFYGCQTLTSLNLSDLQTYNVKDMSSMFYQCKKLKNLILPNSGTPQVLNMTKMFCTCSELQYLDLSHFDTRQVTNMDSMFNSCTKLTKLNLSNFYKPNLKNMRYMFYYCSYLVSLNLSNFDTSQVTNMAYMLYYTNIKSLDLSNFNTTQVTNMDYMFSRSVLLQYLNLSNFNTSQITNMTNMFSECRSLTSLDLSNFDSSKVTNMAYMFNGCSKLNFLNISNFDTSKVENMARMFYGCSNLNSLHISNFDTSKVTNMDYMFYGCSNLNSLDLSNFNTSLVKRLSYMFSGCSSLSTLNLSNFNTEKVTNMANMFDKCSSLYSINLSSFESSQVTNFGAMFDRCPLLHSLDLSNFNISKALNISNMFSSCSNLEYVNLKMSAINNQTSIKNLFYLTSEDLLICSENEDFQNFFSQKYHVICNNKNNYEFKCYYNSNFSKSIYNEYTCDICGKNAYIIYNGPINDNNINETIYINCDESPEGYYLDLNDSLYKLCYESCKTCNIKGNEIEHNCIMCKDDYPNELIISNYKNCYNYTIFYSDILSDTIINDTKIIDTSKNSYYPSELITNSTIETGIFTDIISNKEIKILNRTQLIQAIINNLLNEYNKDNMTQRLNINIIDENLDIILTSTNNPKNNEDNITINLGQCEYILKDYYNISKNDSLYILKLIYKEMGMKIPKVEYEVYYPLLNINNLTKLNLTLCQGTKIQISIPVKINDIIDKYNAESGYYNDFCYKANSEYGTDIILKDRRNEFVNKNMTLCEEKCSLINYDYNKEKAKCSCNIKLNITENFDVKFNKTDFFRSFIDIKNIANLNVLKCYKIVFKINNLKRNYGFFIISFIFLLYYITLFIFRFKSYYILKKDIKTIIAHLKISEEKKEVKEERIIKKSGKNKKHKKLRKKSMHIEHIDKEEIKTNIKRNSCLIELKNKRRKRKSSKGNYLNQITQNFEDNSINMMNFKKKGLTGKKEKYIKELLEQKDFEINSLDYEEAIKIDQRHFLAYYLSLIKNNHPLIFSFASYKDYNPRIIKMFLFFLSFSLDLSINALFFDDDNMHKIYLDRGKFNFLYQIPQILYSTLISRFIDSLIKYLSLSQDNIVDIKKEKDKKILDKKYFKKLMRTLKIKFISFFIISFIILGFFWYYTSCFCGIYVNTQKHLIKDSVMSLITSLFYPFVMLLIPGIFRIPALRVRKQTCLYKLSSLLENFLG